MVKFACDPGLLLVQAAWKNLTWEPWIAKCRGPPTLPLRFCIFKCRKGRYWLEPEDCLRHRFELLEIIIFMFHTVCTYSLHFFWTRNPSFPAIVTNYTTKKWRLSEKNPHTLGTYPRFPTVYAGEFPRVWVCLGPTGFREFLRFSMAGTVVGSRDEKFGNDLESDGYLHRVSLFFLVPFFPSNHLWDIYIFFQFSMQSFFQHNVFPLKFRMCFFDWKKPTYHFFCFPS